MFRALSERVSSFLSPQQRTAATGSPKRKRRITDDIEDIIPTSTKRTKTGTNTFFNKWNWRFGNLFKRTVGEIEFSSAEAEVAEIVVEEDTQVISEEIEMSTRKILTASRKKDRFPIPQLSNTTILDLTAVDEDQDVQITKCTIDLTSPLSENTTIPLDETTRDAEVTNVTIDLTTGCNQSNNSTLFGCFPATNTIGPLRRHKSGSLLHETVRLDERQRYKTLLAQYTNIIMPEYSRSISPQKSSTSVANSSTLVTSLSTSFGKEEKDARPIVVDLTTPAPSVNTPSPSAVRCTPPGRKFFHELLSESRKSPPSLLRFNTTSPCTSPSTSLSFHTPGANMSSNNMTSSSSANLLLDTDWFKKWRETLDPVSLERERRITEEEQRVAAIKRKQQEEFEELEKKNREKAKKSVLPELTPEMKSRIKQSLGPGSARDVLVEGFNAEITRADIATLRPSVWLNDEVVNFYFNLLKERSEQDPNLPKIHVFNTFFYPKIEKMGHSGVKRWTRKVDIFAVDLILLPVHLGMHWCMAAIDNRSKQIIYYDSLRGNNPKCIATLRKYLNDESMDKKKKPFDFDGWTDSMPKEIPEQMNGCDCGVFASMYAEFKSRDCGFTFTQDNMPYFRQRMVYEIVSKKLL